MHSICIPFLFTNILIQGNNPLVRSEIPKVERKFLVFQHHQSMFHQV